METYLKILFISFAVSAITFTVAVTSIFEWFREFVSSLHHKLEELIHCPFCLSFYISGIVLGFAHVHLLLFNNIVFDLLITMFAVMCISGILHYVLLRAYEPITQQMLIRSMQKRDETSEEEDSN